MRSPLGRAVGLGSAKEGVEHWWLQRITAVALVPLSLWFVIAIIRLVGADVDSVRDWVGNPLPAIMLVLLLIATFYHASLGLQVVIEDYVNNDRLRIGSILLVKGLSLLLALACIVSVLRLGL